MHARHDDAGLGPELLLQLGAGTGTGGSLALRVSSAIRDAVQTGRLLAGTRLPSSRSLAADLGLSRGVVVEAYARLSDEGVLLSRAGSGTRVAAGALVGSGPRPAPAGPAPDGRASIDLRPGPPDLSAFPRAAWSAAVREVLRDLPDRELGYVTPWGTEALRGELGAYLARVRGAQTDPGAVVVVSGVTQGLTLLARVLHRRGHRHLAVESPSNGVQREVLGSHGLRVVDVAVDEQGLDVSALARTPCRAVLVTPAHQFPRGTQMSPERRAALVRWAGDVDGVVLEDDYDAEFRYEREAMACLQSLAPTRVALVGSVSKTLAPGLRLGWVVAPPDLREAVIATKRNDDFGTGVLEQHTLAHLLRSGVYDRHVRSLRHRYRRRRDAFTSAVRDELPGWRTAGVAAGLHVLLELPDGLPEQALVDAAAARGVVVQGTSAMHGTLPPQPALVVCYARVPATLLHEGARRIAAAAEQARSPRAGGRAAARLTHPPATASDYF